MSEAISQSNIAKQIERDNAVTREMTPIDVVTGKPYVPPVERSVERNNEATSFDISGVLKGIGWLNLLAGLVAGIWLIAAAKGPYSFSERNPIMTGVGTGLILEGAIGCVLILGFASIVENLTIIRRRLKN